jgi:hypothetical protein
LRSAGAEVGFTSIRTLLGDLKADHQQLLALLFIRRIERPPCGILPGAEYGRRNALSSVEGGCSKKGMRNISADSTTDRT